MFDIFNDMRKEMNELFKDFFEASDLPRQELSSFQESDKEFIASLEMPDVDKKDIILTIKDNMLEIKAEKKHELKLKKKDSYRYEKSYSGFYRKMQLPPNIIASELKSEFKNNILKITIPKKKKLILESIQQN